MWIMTEHGWRPFHRPACNSNNLQGVFVERNITEVRATIDARHARWTRAMQYEETRKNLFRGDAFIEQLPDAIVNG